MTQNMGPGFEPDIYIHTLGLRLNRSRSISEHEISGTQVAQRKSGEKLREIHVDRAHQSCERC